MRLLLFFIGLSLTGYTQSLPRGLTTIEGKAVEPSVFNNHKAIVFIFLSPECPLCQSYSLTLKQLYTKYHKLGIGFVGIIPGNDFNAEVIKNYQQTYQVPFPIYRDKQHTYVKYMKATITPEVFLLNGKHKILYGGRIDNWAYELGKKRKVITENNLKDALDAFITNQPIKTTKTKAVGCFIE